MNTNTNEILYAWFSKEQAEELGYSIYLDKNGKAVSCTEVSKESIYHGYRLDNLYVGKVVKFLCSIEIRENEY